MGCSSGRAAEADESQDVSHAPRSVIVSPPPAARVAPAPVRRSASERVASLPSHAAPHALSPSASLRLDIGEGHGGLAATAAARCVSETYAGDAAAVIALAKRAREVFCR